MTTAGTKRLTFEEWQALPETKQKCEVVDGVLVTPPSPFGEHPWAIHVFYMALDPFLSERGMGIALTAPYDVLIRRDPLRVRQPDMLVVNEELTGIARPADLAGLPRIERPPLLAVEVLSPSNTPRDIEERWPTIGAPAYRKSGWRVSRLAPFGYCVLPRMAMLRPLLTGWATCCAPRCCQGSSWPSTTFMAPCWGWNR